MERWQARWELTEVHYGRIASPVQQGNAKLSNLQVLNVLPRMVEQG